MKPPMPKPSTAAPVRKSPVTLPAPKKPALGHPETIAEPSFAPAKVLFDSTDVPPGQVRRQVGQVFTFARNEYIVEKVSASNAKARCLTRVRKEVTNKLTGETASFESSAQFITISNCCDPADILRTETNFQSMTAGINQETKMKKETVILTGIDLLITKAIASKKDDNKIAAMCLANYPDVPVAQAAKLIAKYRKSGAVVGKVQTVKAPKAAKVSGEKTGSAQLMRQLHADGVKKKDAFARMLAKYPVFEHDTVGLESRWAMAEKIAASKKAAGKAPAKTAPAKKVAAKTPPVRKAATPPAPKKSGPPAPKAPEQEPTAETDEATAGE